MIAHMALSLLCGVPLVLVIAYVGGWLVDLVGWKWGK